MKKILGAWRKPSIGCAPQAQLAQQQAQHPQQHLMYPLRQEETKQQVTPDALDGIVSLASGTAVAQRPKVS